MKSNEDRLMKTINQIGNIGFTPGYGITRLAYSDEYKHARSLLAMLMEREGLIVHTDTVGNIFGRRDGLDNTLPAIMIGSHLDTVKNGGLYDGNLGVCAALELVRVLNECSIKTKHPLEITAFIAEEGDIYGGTFGSRSIMGLQDVNEVRILKNLQDVGVTKEDIVNAKFDVSRIAAFLELHIEQGGILDMAHIPVGIVSGIAGISRFKINIKGETNHAGTTPMSLRKDSVVAAGKIIGIIDNVAREMGEPLVATIGVLDVKPGFVNVISGEVEMTLEVRDLEQERIDSAIKQISDLIQDIEGFEIKIQTIMEKPSVKTNPYIIQLIESICAKKSISYKIMASGAGHDAKALAKFVPTGMIFIPSVGGRSHCKEEFSTVKDIVCGVDLLIESVLALDKELI